MISHKLLWSSTLYLVLDWVQQLKVRSSRNCGSSLRTACDSKFTHFSFLACHSGSLPASIGNWTKLETFQIYGADPVTTEVFPDNHFDSALPDTIGQWRSITLFDVSQQDDNHPTSFTGTLPESISQWTDLEIRVFRATL